MKSGQLVLSLLFWITAVICTAPVQLFARSLTTDKSLKLGVLVHNETVGTAQVVDLAKQEDFAGLEIDSEYCFGAEINGVFQCHSLQKLTSPLSYDLVLTTKPTTGELVSISFIKSSTTGINPIIRPASPGAKPSLVEVKPPKASTNRKQKDPNSNSDEELAEEEEEELPQTFLQKYWMFIVPVGILLLTSGSGGQ